MMHAGVNVCPSIDYLERAWQDAALGGPPSIPTSRRSCPPLSTRASRTTAAG